MSKLRPIDHVGNFNFKVEIEGLTTAAVSKVDGLIGTVAFGGRAGVPGRVTLHGVSPLDQAGKERLGRWYKASQGGVRSQRSVSIVKYDRGSREVERQFFEAWPCKWKGFSLEGKGTDVAVELAHSGLSLK